MENVGLLLPQRVSLSTRDIKYCYKINKFNPRAWRSIFPNLSRECISKSVNWFRDHHEANPNSDPPFVFGTVRYEKDEDSQVLLFGYKAACEFADYNNGSVDDLTFDVSAIKRILMEAPYLYLGESKPNYITDTMHTYFAKLSVISGFNLIRTCVKAVVDTGDIEFAGEFMPPWASLEFERVASGNEDEVQPAGITDELEREASNKHSKLALLFKNGVMEAVHPPSAPASKQDPPKPHPPQEIEADLKKKREAGRGNPYMDKTIQWLLDNQKEWIPEGLSLKKPTQLSTYVKDKYLWPLSYDTISRLSLRT